MEPFLGQLTSAGFGWAPRQWAQCDGQLMPITQNSALFALIGTQFGGDGRTTFALPDLRGRTPMGTGQDHQGNTYVQGRSGGAESVTLSMGEMAAHAHGFFGTSEDGDAAYQTGSEYLAKAQGGVAVYHTASNLTPMGNLALSEVGGNQAHDNMQPFLAINFVIALEGVFPSRN